MASNKLEFKIYRFAIRSTLVALVTLLLFDAIRTWDISLILFEVFVLILFSVFYYFSGDPQTYPKYAITFGVIMFLLLDIGWYLAGGLKTSVSLLYFLATIAILSYLPQKNRFGFILFTGLNLSTVILLEFYYPELLPAVTGSPESTLITNAVFIAITFSIGMYVISQIKNMYELERVEVKKQNLQLEQQNRLIDVRNAELEIKHKEIQNSNEQLVRKIEKESESLAAHRKKILEYTFINSHQMRAPLANILGFLDILSFQVKDEKDPILADLITSLEREAIRLDEQIQQTQEALETT